VEVENTNMRKFKVQEVKDDLWEMLNYLPNAIWWVGMFIIGYVVGSW
jgi:hypothetical protein